jgi:hypothetical protein
MIRLIARNVHDTLRGDRACRAGRDRRRRDRWRSGLHIPYPAVTTGLAFWPVDPVQQLHGVQLVLMCPSCRGTRGGRAGTFQPVATFEFRLPESVRSRRSWLGATSGWEHLSAPARIASIGSRSDVVRIPDGDFVVRCRSCPWVRRFTAERLRRVVVISALAARTSPAIGRPIVLPADVVMLDRWDDDWEQLGRASNL